MESLELSDERCRDIMEWLHTKGYAYNTIRQYRHILKKLQLKHRILNRDTLRSVLKWFNHQNQRAVLHAINQYCDENAIDFRLLMPRIKSKPRKLPEIYSLEEIKIIIGAAPHPYNLALRCIFNMGAGLRVSEIIKLSWNHINWANWIGDKQGYGTAIIKDGKGGKERPINIPQNLMKDLYDYAKESTTLNEYGIPVGGMIFPMGANEFKRELMRTNLEAWKRDYLKAAYDWFRYNIIEKHCEKALGKKIKVHSLRHSRATYLYEIEHVPLVRLQELLGHTDIRTTTIYTQVNPVSTFELLKETREV